MRQAAAAKPEVRGVDLRLGFRLGVVAVVRWDMGALLRRRRGADEFNVSAVVTLTTAITPSDHAASAHRTGLMM